MNARELALALWRRRDPGLLPHGEALLERLPGDDADRRRLLWEVQATRAHRRFLARLPFGRPVRLWLDDDTEHRVAPPGWLHVASAWEAMALLTAWPVVEASLDHDLGDGARHGRAIDVLGYLEELEVRHGAWRWPATVTLHSAEAAGREAMAGLLRGVARRCAAREERQGDRLRFRLTQPADL
ncbi:MAG TPA: cyclic-phosphate processing receiver domain-containing protein [Baekduia sp.]|nr:cyclic-phosphate processing receiver domain-containing protein [Baekduia sp.]